MRLGFFHLIVSMFVLKAFDFENVCSAFFSYVLDKMGYLRTFSFRNNGVLVTGQTKYGGRFDNWLRFQATFVLHYRLVGLFM